MRDLVVGPALFLFWVLLSGHFTPLLLSMGAISALLVVGLLRRMDSVDNEVSWVRPSLGLVRYAGWLLWTVSKSSADVARRVWNPALPIHTSWTRLNTEISTPLLKTLYANSITLTPGTLTTSVHKDHLMIHSLAEENIAELQAGEMQRRIRNLVL